MLYGYGLHSVPRTKSSVQLSASDPCLETTDSDQSKQCKEAETKHEQNASNLIMIVQENSSRSNRVPHFTSFIERYDANADEACEADILYVVEISRRSTAVKRS